MAVIYEIKVQNQRLTSRVSFPEFNYNYFSLDFIYDLFCLNFVAIKMLQESDQTIRSGFSKVANSRSEMQL